MHCSNLAADALTSAKKITEKNRQAGMRLKKNRVIVAMSGGVDSSVCAYLLKQRGYEVIGMTMQIWQDDPQDTIVTDDGCCSLGAVHDARRVADKIGIPYYVINLKKSFKEKVIDYFVDEYISGYTPNPCIACNKYLKFDALLKKALELDAFYIATGHYARVEYDVSKCRYILKKSKDKTKDQSYALYNLSQFQLKHTLFPLGEYTKKEIRDIAKNAQIPVAKKPDSQEICFIKSDYRDYLKSVFPGYIAPGPFVDKKGNIMGQHKGIPFYTVGQRRGLGIHSKRPLYVIKIDAEKNVIVLGYEEDVYVREFTAGSLNWISFEDISRSMRVNAKIRYNFEEKPAEIFPIDGKRVKVVFEDPQKSPAPGQAVVFYNGDELIGGGTIEQRTDLE